MTGPAVDEFVRRAEEVDATRLRAVLEPDHADDFVAIEPESGDSFLEIPRSLEQDGALIMPGKIVAPFLGLVPETQGKPQRWNS